LKEEGTKYDNGLDYTATKRKKKNEIVNVSKGWWVDADKLL
jgi:hypothetical protein